MAEKIRGITIELSADTTQLSDAFKTAKAELSKTESALKDVNKALKLNPDSVELLTQKQKYLSDAVVQSNKKVEELDKILADLQKQDGGTGKLTTQMEAVKREIEATKGKASDYEKQLAEVKGQTTETTTETSKLGEALNNAGSKATSFGETLKKNLSVTDLVNGTKAVVDTVKAVGEAMINTAKESAAFADDMMTMSSQFGMSTESLQEYSYMAELVDTDVSTITGSLTKMKRNMDSARDGTGTAAEAFEKLGISVTDSDGNLRDSNEVFDEVIGALGNMTNETERDAAAMNIFGKSAADLNPLIEAGADNIDAFRQEAHDMGFVLSDETLDALGQMDDSFQRLNNVGTTVKNQLGNALAPVIADLTNKFIDWAGSVDWEEVGKTIGEVIYAIIEVVKALVRIIKTVWNTVKPFIDKIVEAFKSIKFEWPKIKLPHFGITPKGWKIGDLLKGSIPKLGIDWYAKAMQNGMILNGATIFGMNKNGQLMGGGERGSETIVGTNNLMRMIEKATANSGMTVNMTVNASAGMDEKALADYTIERLQFMINQQKKVWG